MIWGINTLFLLDSGLNNTQAFTANAAFLLGQMLFEVPTGVVADMWGRRRSLLLGSATFVITTLLYLLLWYVSAPLILWIIVSMFLGLGFTFFSGATEAWLVDALQGNGYKGVLDSVFAKAQVATGVAMFTGSVLGGVVAQSLGIGWPYVLRAVLFLLVAFVTYKAVHDIGFKPSRAEKAIPEMKRILTSSIEFGYRTRPVRWVVMTNLFLYSTSFYVFYAAQPHLLELFGNSTAYSVAGLAAAIVACSQILGGLFAGKVIKLFRYRTMVMASATIVGTLALLLVWRTDNFYLAIVGFMLWAMSFAMTFPVFQSYINGLIPSAQRATILSFSSMIGSAGGAATQTGLGKVADVYGYGQSFLASAILQALSLPFFFKARGEHAASDNIKK